MRDNLVKIISDKKSTDINLHKGGIRTERDLSFYWNCSFMFLDVIQGLEVFPDDEDHEIDSSGVKSFTAVTRKALALRDTFS